MSDLAPRTETYVFTGGGHLNGSWPDHIIHLRRNWDKYYSLNTNIRRWILWFCFFSLSLAGVRGDKRLRKRKTRNGSQIREEERRNKHDTSCPLFIYSCFCNRLDTGKQRGPNVLDEFCSCFNLPIQRFVIVEIAVIADCATEIIEGKAKSLYSIIVIFFSFHFFFFFAVSQ